MLRSLFDSAGNCYRCRNGLRWRKARKKRHDDHEAWLNVRDSSIEPADRGQNCTMDTPRARRRLFRDIRRCLLLSHSLRTSGLLCRAKQTTKQQSIHSLTTRTTSMRHPPHEISIGYRRATMTPREWRKFSLAKIQLRTLQYSRPQTVIDCWRASWPIMSATCVIVATPRDYCHWCNVHARREKFLPVNRYIYHIDKSSLAPRVTNCSTPLLKYRICLIDRVRCNLVAN